jgi:predicted DNA-binding transcriptional regulator YafY
MSASRLLSILILLQLRSRLTAEALAEEFEVSVRTVYRDIDRLSAAGVPIYGDRGPGGGFQLLDGYKTRLTGLDTDEACALLMAGLPGPAKALGIGDAAGRARRKMLAALPPTTFETAGKLGERFHLDTTNWYRLNDPPPHLPALAHAVFEERRIRTRYESWTQSREWTLDPLGLVLKGGDWYLVGQSGERLMTLRVDNMRDLAVTDEAFERSPSFDLAAWWSASLLRFEAELRPSFALLRLSPLGLKRLAAIAAFAEAAVRQAADPDSDGWRVVELPVEAGDHSALALLGIGPEFEVIAPETLRRRIAELALGIAGRAEA